MNVALDVNNTYQNFELEKDIFYFRVGERGLVSFHGKNFNIRKRLSSDELQELLAKEAFFKVNTDSYVNTKKIGSIHDGKVFFESRGTETKFTAVTKLRQFRLKEILARKQA